MLNKEVFITLRFCMFFYFIMIITTAVKAHSGMQDLPVYYLDKTYTSTEWIGLVYMPFISAFFCWLAAQQVKIGSLHGAGWAKFACLFIELTTPVLGIIPVVIIISKTSAEIYKIKNMNKANL